MTEEKTEAKCLHKNIVITEKNYYTIPIGYDEAMELENLDMADYFDKGEQDSVFCEDCGAYLD
jgi:hypothetical protein